MPVNENPAPSASTTAPARGGGKFVVGRVDDIPEGGRIIVDIRGRSVGIFRINGKFHALLNRCPHRGAELCRGTVVGLVESERPGDWRYDTSTRLIECPWHGWEFDITTGQSYFDPLRTRVRPYEVEVESGEHVSEQVAAGQVAPVGAGDREIANEPLDKLPSRLRKGPYTAETIPVSVEGEYIVISLRPGRPKRTTGDAPAPAAGGRPLRPRRSRRPPRPSA
jgi:3-phenylpropionate/trans-cinnamate dioxygenase ferredoxin subunit